MVRRTNSEVPVGYGDDLCRQRADLYPRCLLANVVSAY